MGAIQKILTIMGISHGARPTSALSWLLAWHSCLIIAKSLNPFVQLAVSRSYFKSFGSGLAPIESHLCFNSSIVKSPILWQRARKKYAESIRSFLASIFSRLYFSLGNVGFPSLNSHLPWQIGQYSCTTVPCSSVQFFWAVYILSKRCLCSSMAFSASIASFIQKSIFANCPTT